MDFLINKLRGFGDRSALVINNQEFSFSEIVSEIESWSEEINTHEIPPGSVVAIEGETSVRLIGLIFALALHRNIIVPVKTENTKTADKYKQLAHAEYVINPDNKTSFIELPITSDHEHYRKLRKEKHAGIVLFSSGTTGAPKGIVLSFNKLLTKFGKKESVERILSFLNYDHIGGINTIIHGISGGGCVVFPVSRDVKTVLRAIEQWHVEVLPTTPTFINMIIMSNSHINYNLSSLKLITYGTEAMSSVTLEKITTLFQHVRFKQTYGLSEVGILPTKSKSNNELWLKIGGAGFDYKIINNILWVKSDMAMLGYLNAKAPFDQDGYFNTQDMVEIEGEYIRILGRESEMINVAGEKVYPAEIEGVLVQVPDVLDASVTSIANPVTGMGIKALIRYREHCNIEDLRIKIIRHARENLEGFKQPMLYSFTLDILHTSRFKKRRTVEGRTLHETTRGY